MPTPTPRFLIVDDSHMMRKVVHDALIQLGYTDMIEAGDGTLALREIKSAAFMGKPFDFVLTDLWMIDMGGHQLLKTCQADPELRASKFVFVTAEREKKHLDALLSDGAAGYIFKPVDANLLREKLKEISERFAAPAAPAPPPLPPAEASATDELQVLLNAVPGFVLKVTSDFEIQEANLYLRATFNVPAREVIGLDLIRSLFSSHPPRSTFELKADIYGEIHHFLVVAQKYNNNSECILVGVPTTAQKRAEEKLKMMGSRIATAEEIASEISHQASVPLLVIQTRAMRLRKLAQNQDDPISTSELKESLEKIEASTQQLKKMVKGLRSFSKMADREPIRTASLKTMMEEILEFWRGRFMERQIDLQESDFRADLPLDCRENEMSQVIFHLTNSAFDSVDRSALPKKWVKIDVVETEANVEIHIVFSVGSTGSSAGKRLEVDGGIASGLSISKRVIEDHHGRLLMNSDETLGQAKFIISLPASASASLRRAA